MNRHVPQAGSMATPARRSFLTGLLGLLPLFGLGFAFFLPGRRAGAGGGERSPRDGVLVAAGASVLAWRWRCGCSAGPDPGGPDLLAVGARAARWRLGMLLRRSGSLVLCLQVAVLAGV